MTAPPAMWHVSRVDPARDLDDVMAIEQESFVRPWTPAMFIREIEHPEVSHLFLARFKDGTAAGYCAVRVILDELHINNIAIRPAYRRQGVARVLLAYVFREAWRLGARRATLEVRRSNDGALGLYDALGFVETAVRHGYYTSPPEDALILWMDLLETPQGV
jgi:ribosomal-protein-alanine N-acetyltransferase